MVRLLRRRVFEKSEARLFPSPHVHDLRRPPPDLIFTRLLRRHNRFRMVKQRHRRLEAMPRGTARHKRTLTGFQRFRGQDRALDRLIVGAGKGQPERRSTSPKPETRRVYPRRRVPLPSSFAAYGSERACGGGPTGRFIGWAIRPCRSVAILPCSIGLVFSIEISLILRQCLPPSRFPLHVSLSSDFGSPQHRALERPTLGIGLRPALLSIFRRFWTGAG